MNKKVCVIGAGLSGIVAIKELLNEGITVKCFEKQNGAFGAFRPIEDGGRSYDSLKLTVSNYFMSFSDFMPNLKEKRRYWSVAEYRSYLQRYIEHHNLSKYIHTQHEVTSADYRNDKVFVTIDFKGEKITEIFDNLIICSGSNFSPKIPNWKNRHLFKGRIYHSSEYKNIHDINGKNIVCVGLGESAADILHEISQITFCKVLIRDYPNVIPRWINGFTNDAYTSYGFYLMKAKGINYFMKLKSWYYLNFDKTLNDEDKLIQTWIFNRKDFMSKFFTKNDVFIKDIINNRIELLNDELKSFTKSGIITKKGQVIKADVIFCNTGYVTNFEKFSFGSSFSNPRKLFKQMIHPKYGNRISLIGWARPTQGGLPACSEMQARYISQLISEKKTLPKQSKLEKLIENDKIFYDNLFSKSKGIDSLVSYHEYMISLAKLIGCNPKFFYWRDIKLTKRLFYGSHLSAFYRLSNLMTKQSAINSIKSLPIAYTKRRSIVILLFILFFNPLSRIINWFSLKKEIFKQRLSLLGIMLS